MFNWSIFLIQLSITPLSETAEFVYRSLKNKKLLAIYYKKFQKHDEALKVLMDVYKEERKIFNQNKNKEQQISSISEEVTQQTKTEEEAKVVQVSDQDEQPQVLINDGVAIAEEELVEDKPTLAHSKSVSKDKQNRNIQVRLGTTMTEIMNVFSMKRDKIKAHRFREEAEKHFLEGLAGDRTNKYFIRYLASVGDMYLRFGSKSELDEAYKLYDEANKTLELTKGKDDSEFLLSMVDIGNVYLEKKSYTEAEAFYTFSNSEFERLHGNNWIFKHRANSALVDVYSSSGAEHKQKAYDYSMGNVNMAMAYYGENSLFWLGYYISGMSANIQTGKSVVAENMLNKMMRVLESAGEIGNGNQYFFLAWVLLGVVCYSTNKFEQAHMFFTSTMKKQLEYTGGEQDHPFLEQTYLHMASMYKQMGNLNSSLIMWKNLLKTHKRQYGENNYLLSSDYKNIGTCEVGVGMIAEGIKTLEKAKVLIKCGIEKVEDEAEIKELKRELSEVFFALYLGYTTQSEWDKAISANEQALKLNIDTLGEDDLNVSNNYYLGSQIYQKKLCFEEAMNHINKANEIIDTKTVKDPLLLCRYRFLRGKLLVNADQRENALKDLDEAIKVAQANPKLYNDEIEIKIFRTNAINSFSEEEIKRFGIDLEAEKAKTLADDAKREKIIKLQTAAAQSHAQSNGQPQPIGNAEKEEDEDEEETLFDGPAGVIAAVGGVVAVGAGIYYFMSKSN